MEYAIGVVCCDRVDTDLTKLTYSIREKWQGKLAVFPEHGFLPICLPFPAGIELAGTPQGPYVNYVRCLRWLYTNTRTPFVLVFEDDIELCASAAEKLDTFVGTDPGCAAISLYTPEKDGKHLDGEGWHAYNPGYDAWGTQAICYSRAALNAMVESSLLDDAVHGFYKPYDGCIFDWLLKSGRSVYYHNPSLVQHLQAKSLIGSEPHYGYRYDASY